MFDQLSDRIQKVTKYLRGEVKITEKNMAEALRMLRLAFLEADVNYRVVKEFEAKIKEKALEEKVLKSLSPAQQVIKIVRDDLTEILGGVAKKLEFSSQPPTIFMLVGLQGSGKTTTCGKLAKWAQALNKKPLLVSFDLKRPAAQDQLKMIAETLSLPFFELSKSQMSSPKKALKDVVEHAKKHGFDPLIVDTAGRLHVDEELMEELRIAKEVLKPNEVIYVGDSMTGQDAVKSASLFDEKIGLESIILTKLDGDSRGGAALSIVSVTGKPIKFVGTGEKFDKFEIFHPDRMASRILGLGDMLGLIEKAEQDEGLQEAKELAKKMTKEDFSLEDFKKQLMQLRKMGPLSQFMGMLPKAGPFKNISKMNIDDKKMIYFEAIINSMTSKERLNPKIIQGSRRSRIARGSGRPVSEVNQLLKQFFEMKKMMKKSSFKNLLSSFPGM
ncbi:MAG: signal recognition particle protein [Candidatus Aminicenantes bacterium]|nr:signal recognition particle protein [Candidatus Aminicenantes bacterium]